MDNDSQWTVDKVMSCLKWILHGESFDQISFKDFHIKKTDKFKDIQKIRQIIEFVSRKYGRKIEVYGTIDEILRDVLRISDIPEIHRLPLGGLTTEQILETEICCSSYLAQEDNEFYAKNDVFILLNRFIKEYEYSNIARCFIDKWFALFVSEKLEENKDVHEFVTKDILECITESFYQPIDRGILDFQITIEHFQGFREFWPKDNKFFDEVFIKKLKNKARNMPMATNQQFYKETFFEIVTILSRCPEVFRIYGEFLKPNLKIEEIKIFTNFPVARCFEMYTNGRKLMFTTEIEYAIRLSIARKGRVLEEGFLSCGIREDRKMGIVLAISYETVENVMKVLGLSIEKDINIIHLPMTRNFDGISYPVLSQYSTHCKYSEDCFREIQSYLCSWLRVFQFITSHNFDRLVKWIEDLNGLFAYRNMSYFIECWKIDEIIRRAKKELNCLKTRTNSYKIPVKESYTDFEVIQEAGKLIGKASEEEIIGLGMVLNEYKKMLKVEDSLTIRHIWSVYCNLMTIKLYQKSQKIVQMFQLIDHDNCTDLTVEQIMSHVQFAIHQENFFCEDGQMPSTSTADQITTTTTNSNRTIKIKSINFVKDGNEMTVTITKDAKSQPTCILKRKIELIPEKNTENEESEMKKSVKNVEEEKRK
ncbi:unnamed protein product [Caenorhabditis angaria]|uniref:Uncharacterized protein n=1 Tax=Caenorhabditis angaria TaxID=860376 RepID=A0A9P1IQM5_9PELO|nr:unnamed protein product [Caenorhabditis angaria]